MKLAPQDRKLTLKKIAILCAKNNQSENGIKRIEYL